MSKTPVSILQEFCARNSVVPQYDLVINGVGTHDPIFKYQLTVNEVITYGIGKSKKEAKHDAARAALTALHISQNNMKSLEKNQPEILEKVEDITSPYHGALKENAVGELNVICCNNKLPAPDYIITGEEGPAHARLFTCECHVAKLIATAASRTKKQAKHLSAKEMLQRLVKMLGDTLVLTPPEPTEDARDDEINEKAKEVYSNMKSPKCNENFNLLIKDYHNVDLATIFGDNPKPLIELANYNTDANPSIQSLNLLQKLLTEAEVKYSYTLLPPVDKHYYIYNCELDSCPTFVVFGMGSEELSAKSQAAHKMLFLLKSFSHGLNVLSSSITSSG